MPDPYFVNPSVLEPLFETWQEPSAHRVRAARAGDLLAAVTDINNFRNTYVAHQEKDLTDAKLAEKNLRQWIQVLRRLSEP